MPSRPLVISSLLICAVLCAPATWGAEVDLGIESENKVLRGRAAQIVLRLVDDHAQPLATAAVTLTPKGSWALAGAPIQSLSLVTDADGRIVLDELIVHSGSGDFDLLLADGTTLSDDLHAISRFWVVVPPLLAILLALIFRQVILALAAGVWIGAWILTGNPAIAFLRTLDQFIVGAVTDEFQATMILFTASMGGMVGVMARSGGTQGVVDLVSRWIRGVRSAQLMTWLMGIIIFFDDYANTLVVGNTMRPITDRLRISREKLAFVVDSTAAPVVTIAWISTWVGYQVTLIRDGLGEVGLNPNDAYPTFLASIPYSAYSIFALCLVLMIALMDRDYGPMLKAERRCRQTGAAFREGATPLMDEVGNQLAPAGRGPARAHQALAPVVVLLVVTILGLYFDGRGSLLAELGSAGLDDIPLRRYFSEADPARALFWAAIAGSGTAVLLTVAERTLSLAMAIEAWVSGLKAMMTALIILVFAWSIKDVCSALGTGPVVVDWASGFLSPRLLPTISFLLSAFIGFATGTSWAAMAILMPIVIPLAHQLPLNEGIAAGQASGIFLGSVASVLSGSVWGDHCSPISDTTIMSSMASGADHVDHVRTQLPYALTAGTAAILLGTIPAGFGVSPWLTLPLGLLVLFAAVRFVGRPVGA